ncbi:TKL/DRK protein kinase [Saprolegnia diclina VS20]|uniref:TKL/DRK protein kinase n=1 Tax=Saprolegnia diclina (strain VS20) TaxID=1156394 RepID=T0QZP8_SAPDV|nr:TKL/DRK protein kinase [Saprolegnia diclina VS20]EQC39505.1 TKL/DRK protein kinase [Saprolegnia diclina VS20]|eukprot:XP_008606777.1 TKL/DRK protein kinase [Saprolegnia diclina VS20]
MAGDDTTSSSTLIVVVIVCTVVIVLTLLGLFLYWRKKHARSQGLLPQVYELQQPFDDHIIMGPPTLSPPSSRPPMMSPRKPTTINSTNNSNNHNRSSQIKSSSQQDGSDHNKPGSQNSANNSDKPTVPNQGHRASSAEPPKPNVTDSAFSEVDDALDDFDPKWRLPKASVVITARVAKGAFGEVFLGTYLGETTVAVKSVLKEKRKLKVIQAFIDEIKLMARLDSPYIVRFYGAIYSHPSRIRCVMEYMDSGDLKDFLKVHPRAHVNWAWKLEIALCIAKGLVYLHELPVIHRDLKSRNILMDSHMGSKLSDFGVSREETTETMTRGVGTYRWMAPEVLKDGHYSVAADIFSFGVILTELDTHQIPYLDKRDAKGKMLSDANLIAQVLRGTMKPSFSSDCPPWVRVLALQCMSNDPSMRPTASDLAVGLQQRLDVEKSQM